MFYFPGEQVQNLNLRIIIVFTAGTPSVQTVGTKVGTPVSLTGQRFTVQIPSSQAASVNQVSFYLRISSSSCMDHMEHFVPISDQMKS